jgi:hypothetical protein
MYRCLVGCLMVAIGVLWATPAAAQLDESDFGNIILVVDDLPVEDAIEDEPASGAEFDHNNDETATGVVIPDAEEMIFTDDESEEEDRGDRDGDDRHDPREGRGSRGGDDESDDDRRSGDRFGDENDYEDEPRHRRGHFGRGFGRGFGPHQGFGPWRGMAFGRWSHWGRFDHGFGRYGHRFGGFGPWHQMARWDRFGGWGPRRWGHDADWG